MTSSHRSTPVSRCQGPAWCTTDHSQARHPDDDEHRSDGVAIELTLRSSSGEERMRMLEIGLLQRQTDIEPWLVIDDGRDIHHEMTLSSARRALGLVRTDAPMRDALRL